MRLLDENKSKVHFNHKVNKVPKSEEEEIDNELSKSNYSNLNDDNSLSSRFMRAFQQDV